MIDAANSIALAERRALVLDVNAAMAGEKAAREHLEKLTPRGG